MENAEIEAIIREYLPQIIHMSLATSADGKPWVCEVHYAFDDELNIYWVSEQSARHSQEVAANPHVSGTMVTQHHLNQLARGVSFEGTAEMLTDVDMEHPALKTYVGRFPGRTEAVREAYVEPTETGRRIYKVTVSDWYLVDGYNGKLGKYHVDWKAVHGSAQTSAGSAQK